MLRVFGRWPPPRHRLGRRHGAGVEPPRRRSAADAHRPCRCRQRLRRGGGGRPRGLGRQRWHGTAVAPGRALGARHRGPARRPGAGLRRSARRPACLHRGAGPGAATLARAAWAPARPLGAEGRCAARLRRQPRRPVGGHRLCRPRGLGLAGCHRRARGQLRGPPRLGQRLRLQPGGRRAGQRVQRPHRAAVGPLDAFTPPGLDSTRSGDPWRGLQPRWPLAGHGQRRRQPAPLEPDLRRGAVGGVAVGPAPAACAARPGSAPAAGAARPRQQRLPMRLHGRRPLHRLGLARPHAAGVGRRQWGAAAGARRPPRTRERLRPRARGHAAGFGVARRWPDRLGSGQLALHVDGPLEGCAWVDATRLVAVGARGVYLLACRS